MDINLNKESNRLGGDILEMLQVGVIGTGAIGRSHIERLNRHVTGARVVAVSDINRKARSLSCA